MLRRTLATDGLVADAATLSSLSSFLQPDGPDRWRFRNSLIRDAAYEGLAYKIRSRLHRAAGETLEAMSTDLDADSPTLALHFWRAGDAERTWVYAQRAGALARHAYANVDAAELYERALDVSRRVPGVTDADRATLWATLGDLRELSGVLDGSVEAYRRAAVLTEDPVARAELFARRARVLERSGSRATALRVIGSARRLLAQRPGQASIAAGIRLDASVAMIRMRQGKLRECVVVADRTVRAARITGDDFTLATTLQVLGAAERQLGLGGAGDRFREALEIFVALGDRPRESAARANLGWVAFYAGRWDEAVGWYTSSRRVALEAGNDFGAAETDLNHAEILIYQGKLDEAEQSLASSARVLKASGVEFYEVCGLMHQARLHLARKELEAAEDLATEAVQRFRHMGDITTALEASLVLAEAQVAGGRPVDALAEIDAAQEAAGGDDQALQAQVHLVRGRALAALGRMLEALEMLESGLTIARAQELRYEEALLLRAHGQVVLALGGPEAQAQGTADCAQADVLMHRLGALA